MLYSAILKGNTIIVDYSENSGDFGQMVKTINSKNKQSVEFYVIPYINYDYYFFHNTQYTFATITENNQDNTKVWAFLQKWKEKYWDLIQKERENWLLKSATWIKDLMVEYMKNYESKIDKVNNEWNTIIDQKQQQLRDSLEKDSILVRMEEKAGHLKESSMELKVNTQKKFTHNKKRRYCFYVMVMWVIMCILYYLYSLLSFSK